MVNLPVVLEFQLEGPGLDKSCRAALNSNLRMRGRHKTRPIFRLGEALAPRSPVAAASVTGAIARCQRLATPPV